MGQRRNHGGWDAEIYLAFDYGTRNIGVAVGQKITQSASLLSPLHYKNNKLPWGELDRLVAEWQPQALIVGVPHTIYGGDLKITALAERFATQLYQRYALVVYPIEEMLTTKVARMELFQQGGYRALQSSSIDSYAAKLILEAWLNQSLDQEVNNGEIEVT